MKTLIVILIAILVPTFANAKGAVVDVALTPAGDFKAKTQDIKGHATLKGDTVTATNVVVNLKNLTTGLSLRDKHARDKYLEVNKYPEMILVNAEGKGGKGKGRIKYRGVEKDVVGTYSIKGNELNAKFPMKLSDFNIKGIKYMGVGVDDEVMVNVELPLKK